MAGGADPRAAVASAAAAAARAAVAAWPGGSPDGSYSSAVERDDPPRKLDFSLQDAPTCDSVPTAPAIPSPVKQILDLAEDSLKNTGKLDEDVQTLHAIADALCKTLHSVAGGLQSTSGKITQNMHAITNVALKVCDSCLFAAGLAYQD